MTKRIAVAGKGGTGKTTLAALMIRYLQEKHPERAILAVDADANANLNETLGLKVEETIAMILEATKQPGGVPTGMTKDVFVEYGLNRALVETKHFDLLVMGNPQGPGCYCYPNDLLRHFMERLSANYDYLLMDNEAGLEHLSRRVLPQADLMLITSDATARGVRSAGRIREIAANVRLELGRMGLIISRSRPGEVEQLSGEIARAGLELLGEIPFDPAIVDYDLAGRALLELPPDTASVKAAEKIFEALAL
ncbi:MAG TPA: AAA family ATPase [Bacillota bacterium]|jgi:CO dehydrogenase maturation factor|nr:AAA family ATPase [Bacillota bacterium]HOA34717.1 AAA family ATPase [Bacillota bacterium]HOJ84325.1 AAA family ATPase [Bacillota bacterium]HOL15752.1 AAA family ATPase [Bacillota bacterium]HPZ11185.1 AAA family ATPase [Bacillota bacterium]